MFGEFEFIEKLKAHAQMAQKAARARLTQSIGDDCAVYKNRKGNEIVITTDLLIEEIDFNLSYTSAADLGHKAFSVSASDIAAMGARALFTLISIGVPQSAWESGFVEEFYRGFNVQAERFHVVNIGGDISRTPKHIIVDSIMIGEVKRGHGVLRSGAHPGDLIFVSGELGGAAAGLSIINDRLNITRYLSAIKSVREEESKQKLISRQIMPNPQLLLGLLLGQKKLASAMIDISDGLSSDILHLCRESGVGAKIDAAAVPVDPNIYKSGLANMANSELLNYALNGGEDFELLFTVKPRNVRRLYRELNGINISQIGVVTQEKGEVLIIENGKARPLIAGGYRHF
ncbi:MAG: thiamine-phosphate kinase [Pyrinomonadaceae bacterium]